ncbi:MAG TPA: serine protein kinase [Planctomycetota bacterium]|nr:serine protein kinase [Planctomycetota bacterium]
MNPTQQSLFEIARQTQERARQTALTWEGSLDEYLTLVEAQPALARNAWQRLYDMIESHGSVASKQRGGARHWKLFDDPFDGGRDAIYGLDATLDEFVMTIRAGARGLGPERRVLLLHGPVGAAKSTIARILKRGLEHYSKSDAGAIYTFTWSLDEEQIPSPMHQDPLLLVPEDARAGVEARLNKKHRGEYRLAIRGELDPVSRHCWRTLMLRYDGDWLAMVKHVRVQRFVLSEQDRVGIGTFQPKDEKNQDSTELTGDLNFRKIAQYGSDSDPRAFNFDGEFNVANRGMLEFIEVLKLDMAFLYDLLGATQEHSIKPKKFAQTSIDEVILGHTNEPEYKKLATNELMEAFRDRTIKIDVPYNVTIADERRIYERAFQHAERGWPTLAPHTLDIAALWSVMTRLEEPTHANMSVLQKARLYDGQEVQGFGPDHVADLRAQSKREGMSGISPRYVQDRLAQAMVRADACVDAFDVLDEIEAGLRHHSLISNEETRRRYVQLVSVAREAYEQMLADEVQAVIASDSEELDRLCSKYVDNVRAATLREPVLDAAGHASAPDERLMRAIEEKIEIPESRKDDFRAELMSFIAGVQREGRTFEWRENKRLARALEHKVFEDRRDVIQLVSLVSTVIDPDSNEKIRVIQDRLMRQFGYDQVSATRVLSHVAGLFARTNAAKAPPQAA